MKKKYIGLSLAAAALIVMVGALMLLRTDPVNEDESSTETEKTYVTGAADAPDPARIDVKNESGTFTIINEKPEAEKPELTIEGWEKFSLDSYALGSVSSAAGAMEAKRIIAENASSEELAQYGLNDYRAAVMISLPDGTRTEVIIGRDAPGGEGAYVKRGDSTAVYLVSPTTAEPFIKPATDYINKSVTEPDAENKGFDKLVLSGSDYPEPVVIERSPETAKEAGGMMFGTHHMTSPVKAGVSIAGMQSFATLYGITAEEIADTRDDPETLEKYKLNEPAVSAAVTGEDEAHSFTLRVSAPDEDGHVYLIKSGLPIIYKLEPASLAWFGAKTFDIMEKMAVIPNIDTVSRVTVKTSQKDYIFDLLGEGGDLKVTYDGAELDAKNFKQFYQTLISASYTEEIGAPENTLEMEPGPAIVEHAESETAVSESPEIAEEPSPSAIPTAIPPLLEIEYRYRDGAPPDTVSFFPGPVRRAVMTVNGNAPYYTTSAYVDRVLEDIVKVAAGETVKSYL